MSLNSYAQNFEDVMLWRALSSIEHGFYIDIGAQDPLVDSVSLAFHERGWRGIHVEPTPYYSDLLRQQRPQDTVIQAAIGEGPAVLRFFEIPDTGISTADSNIAAGHRERGFNVREITVPSIPLSAIFEACAGQEIHWLKIDVEGFEKQVLLSWGDSVARPWIVVIESTLPLTQIETHENWEKIIISLGYTQVYFDGLNRYYLSDKHPELQPAFSSPPNVFDDFTLNGTASAPFHQLIKARQQEALAQLAHHKESTKREIEDLTENLATLAKTHATQLLTLHQKNDHSLTEIALRQSEQERNLHEKHTERERELLQQCRDAQQELNSHLRQQAQREQEISAKILTLHEIAAQERKEMASRQSEKDNSLRMLHADRERYLVEQQQAGVQELQHKQQEWAGREQILTKQISVAQQALEGHLRQQALREREIAAQLLSLQEQALQTKNALEKNYNEQIREIQYKHAELDQAHSQELIKKESELRHLEHARAALHQQFFVQLQAEQETCKKLQQALIDLQIEFANTRHSLSWRITAPIRKATSLFFKPAEISTEIPIVAPVLNSQPESPTPENQEFKSNHSFMENPSMTSDRPNKTTKFNPSRTAPSLQALLQFHDSQFVECAYVTLFRRQPDAEGLDYYLGRLRSGVSKIQILGQLLDSPEARVNPAKLPGLSEAVKREKLARLPIVGALIKPFLLVDGNSKCEMRLRSVEQQIFLLDQKSNFQYSQLESSIENLRKLIELKSEKNYPEISAHFQNTTAEPITSTIQDKARKPQSIFSQTISIQKDSVPDVIAQLTEILNDSQEAQQLSIRR